MIRGEYQEFVREDDSVCAIKWKDNKSVLVLSTLVGSQPENICYRWCKTEKKRIGVPQPAAIKLYNEKMGGVDLNDRMISYYRSYFRTNKWPTRMFEHFIDLICVNLWTWNRNMEISKNVPANKKTPLMKFKLDLAKELCSFVVISAEYTDNSEEEDNETPNKKRKFTELPSNLKRLGKVGHLPRFSGDKYASRCRNPKCNKRTRSICIKCNVYLCIGPANCFEKFHSKPL